MANESYNDIERKKIYAGNQLITKEKLIEGFTQAIEKNHNQIERH